jgi:hypothetical protein
MEHPTYYLYFTNELYKNDIDFTVLEKLLKKAKFQEKNIYEKNFDNMIDFLHMYELVPKELYYTRTRLKNYINDLSITNKNNLYNLSYSHNKQKTLQYFIETYEYNPQRNYKFIFKNNQPWYIKLNAAGQGQGNMIIHNYNEFLHKLRTVKNAKHGFILNKYIMNPLLFKDKKFHIRIYFINYINSNNIKKSYLSRYGQIFTARDKYIQEDFGNKHIHDTHLKSSDKDWFFPDDFTNTNITTLDMDNPKMVNSKMVNSKLINDIFQQIRVILKSVAELLAETVGLYDNIKNGFNIIDFPNENNNCLVEVFKRASPPKTTNPPFD